jgi:hypothetical protein
MIPFTKRAEINVWTHLLDIHHRHSHTTEEGMELDIEEKLFP